MSLIFLNLAMFCDLGSCHNFSFSKWEKAKLKKRFQECKRIQSHPFEWLNRLCVKGEVGCGMRPVRRGNEGRSWEIERRLRRSAMKEQHARQSGALQWWHCSCAWFLKWKRIHLICNHSLTCIPNSSKAGPLCSSQLLWGFNFQF